MKILITLLFNLVQMERKSIIRCLIKILSKLSKVAMKIDRSNIKNVLKLVDDWSGTFSNDYPDVILLFLSVLFPLNLILLSTAKNGRPYFGCIINVNSCATLLLTFILILYFYLVLNVLFIRNWLMFDCVFQYVQEEYSVI